MRQREETTKIIEVRIRSELRSAVALEGKSSCFCPCTQSEMELANAEDGGLRPVPPLPPAAPDLVTSLPPPVSSRKRRRRMPARDAGLFFGTQKDGEGTYLFSCAYILTK